MRLRKALDETATSGLHRIAEAHGLPTDEATTRAELVERLLERLSARSHLVELIEALPETERAALDEVRAAGGQARGFLLEKRHPGACERLTRLGFLYRTFTAGGARRGEVFAAPDELLDLLGGTAEAASVTAPPPTVKPPVERRTTDPAFNLFTLASFVLRHTGERGGNAGPREAAFRDEVREWVEEPGGFVWQERWRFYRQLGHAAGLLTRRADGTLATGSSLPDLLSDPPALRERLWKAYLREREWSELARAEVPQAALLAEQVDASTLRGTILALLARQSEGGWVTLDAFVDWVHGVAPAFLREQLDARSAALQDPATDELLLDQPGSWSRIEAPLLRSTLLGPLYWLGAVATTPDGLCLALTRAGAGLLRLGMDEILARPFEPCTWAEDGSLLAPPRTDFGRLLQAERYLTLEARGRPSRYRLERERVAGALAVGGSVAECRQLLERLCEAPVPTRVASDLDSWGERFGALALRPAVVLEARDEAELEAASHLRRV
ncbi:MAG TPA: hypothetical protein VFA49_11720, partial [Chloroflexota bacterium]|nr:hypothetical protein [Chloroflexota bacterium]